jgi:hypothetical protein
VYKNKRKIFECMFISKFIFNFYSDESDDDEEEHGTEEED